MKILYILLFASTLLTSCAKNERKVVARVYDSYLYDDEISALVRDDMTPADSARSAEAYIRSWLRTQILVNESEKNLSDSAKASMMQLMEKYRQTLLLHNYKDNIVNSMVSYTVTDDDIRQYYEQYPSNFVLQDNIYKLNYIVLANNKQSHDNLRTIVNDTTTIGEINIAGHDDVIVYDIDSSWRVLRNIDYLSGINENALVKHIQRGKQHYEFSDSAYIYHVHVLNFVPENNTAPMDYVENTIRNVIVNKRKKEVLDHIEDSLYNFAIDNNKIEIY